MRGEFIKLVKKTNDINSGSGYYFNGNDDNYPQKVELLLQNSVTGRACQRILQRYIFGKGINGKLNNLLQKIAKSISTQNGVFIHVQYNANLDIVGTSVLPYEDCRVGKADDNNYSGTILYSTDFNKEKEIQKFNVFNPDPDVLKYQIKEAKGFKNFKGQVLFYNPDEPMRYPLATCHEVILDLESEYYAAEFTNASLRTGFFGKTVVVTPPLVDSKRYAEYDKLSQEDKKALNVQLSEKDEFKKAISSFIGANNAGGVLHFEMEPQNDDFNIDKQFKVINIDSNIDDKLFKHTEEKTQNNIAKAFYGIPKFFLGQNETALFGNSGEFLKEAQRYYASQVSGVQRMIEEQILEKLYPGMDLKILPLIDEANYVNI